MSERRGSEQTATTAFPYRWRHFLFDMLLLSGWSQEQLAGELGVRTQTVSGWINERSAIQKSKKAKIIEFFGLSDEDSASLDSGVPRQSQTLHLEIGGPAIAALIALSESSNTPVEELAGVAIGGLLALSQRPSMVLPDILRSADDGLQDNIGDAGAMADPTRVLVLSAAALAAEGRLNSNVVTLYGQFINLLGSQQKSNL